MTATLSQSQAELPRLVEIASQGEDVVITVQGEPRARLTRLRDRSNDNKAPLDKTTWVKELEEVRRKYATGNAGPSTEQILNDDRAERI